MKLTDLWGRNLSRYFDCFLGDLKPIIIAAEINRHLVSFISNNFSGMYENSTEDLVSIEGQQNSAGVVPDYWDYIEQVSSQSQPNILVTLYFQNFF